MIRQSTLIVFVKDDTKARMKVDLILLLDKFGYPPVTMNDVYMEVLDQAENFKKYAEKLMSNSKIERATIREGMSSNVGSSLFV